MEINNVQCKSLLTKSRLPEADYCINPYAGCLQGCIYCYARFMRRFTGHKEKWGKFMDIKINAPEILEKELSRNPKKGVVLLGSVTDAYQPIEKKYKITRAILKILLEHNFPISILTKSDLVTRDIDLLRQFDDCDVGLTITSLDKKVTDAFEPRSSSSQARIKALKTLHNGGIKTYVFIGPILPELTDFEEIFAAIQGKVDFVMAESLNLKCGNRDFIEDLLSIKYPNLLPLYKMGFNNEYWNKIEEKLRRLNRKFDIPLKGFYRH